MAYGDFKDWTTRTATKNSKYGLISMVDKFFDKKTSVRVQMNLLSAVLKMGIFQTKS